MVSLSRKPERGLCLKDDAAVLLTDPIFHDLTIVCDVDSAEVRANGAFLSARSSGFREIIYGETTRYHRIHLKGVKSAALRTALCYIHTETVGPNLLSPLEAFETYLVAKHLRLPKLMDLALVHAKQHNDVEDLADARSLLNQAVRVALQGDPMNGKLYDVLLEPFCQRPLEIGELNGLSEEALELLLTRTKTRFTLPFKTPEDKLLLCVVDWAWVRAEHAPGKLGRLAILKRLGYPTEPVGNPSANMRVSLADSRSRESMLMMWPHMDLLLICPHRLKLLIAAIDVITDNSPQLKAFSQLACANIVCPAGHPSKTRGQITATIV